MFTVIIPVHNKLPHIERSVNSVLKQTFQNFELILVDDASTDGSLLKIQEFQDSRIRIFKRSVPGPGGYAARNLGIENARYDWISLLDADDEWEANYLEEVAGAIHRFPSSEIISTNWDQIYHDKKIRNESLEKAKEKYVNFTLEDFFFENHIIWTSAVTIKRKLINEAGMFPDGRCKRGGDMDTWIRCLFISNGNVWVNQYLAHYHRETVNRVTDNKTNPVGDICAVQSIEFIRQHSTDKRLFASMDFFLAKVIYNKMISDYRRGVKYSSTDLVFIRSRTKRLSILFKYFMRVCFFEKKY